MNTVTIFALLALAFPYGCQQQRPQQACNAADSAAVCRATQECFSMPNVTVSDCRARENVMNTYASNFQKNIAPASKGTANGLNY